MYTVCLAYVNRKFQTLTTPWELDCSYRCIASSESVRATQFVFCAAFTLTTHA